MKKKTSCIAVLFLMMAAGFPAAAAAQKQGGIELKSVSEVEIAGTNAKGEKEVKRIEASKANVTPGDTVIFTTTFTNRGNKPAENVAIKNPVPEHMVYVDQSAEGAGTRIEFSVDGGKSFGAADRLIVTVAQGKTRKARPADYTHIRWTVTKPLAPAGKGSVSFKAKVK